MEPKINIGEITVAEYNVIMKQLAEGKISECLNLFMRLSDLGQKAQQAQQPQQGTQTLPPPAA